MALIRCSEDVLRTLLETLPPGDAQTREDWVQELDRQKENFRSAVELPYHTLRAVSDFYHYHNKANSWYSNVLCENFLQDLLWGVNCDGTKQRHPLEMRGSVPIWKQVVGAFLRNNPAPEMEELVQLAHLSNFIPDAHLQRAGKRLSRRCVTLCKLLTSPGAVPVNDLQVALQWQYEFLRGSHRDGPRAHTDLAVDNGPRSIHDSPNQTCHRSTTAGSRLDCDPKDSMPSHGSLSNLKQHPAPRGRSPPSAVSGATAGKPPSLSSFDSGFDGAGSSHVEVSAGWEGLSRLPGTRNSFRPVTRQPEIHEENISSVSDSEDHGVEFDFDTPKANIQIIPKITLDSLNFEIKLERSATPPQNPWLSLPVDDLENSYTVTITQNPSPRKQVRSPNPSECIHHTAQSSTQSRDQPTQTELHTRPKSRGTPDRDCLRQSNDSFEASELSPIRNVFSSTITESRDGPNYTTESIPSMLWDTYDFHQPMQDTCDRITSSLTDVSLDDWELREQEGLRKVEDILEWTAGILEEEEKVTQQEQMLDVLLNAESTSSPWTSWGGAEQISVMSSSDLKAQGVLGLDDSLASVDSDSRSECRSPEAGTETSEDSSGNMVETAPTWKMTPLCHKVELLKELRGLHVLDELIMEENLKIHELRRAEGENPDKTTPPSTGSGRTGEERQAFLLELDREKMEVERMEDCFEEVTHEHQIKKQLSRTKEMMKCSAIEMTSKLKNEEDGDFTGDFLLDCKSHCDGVKHLETLPQDTITFESKESLCITETLSATTPQLQDFAQSVSGQSGHADNGVSDGEDATEIDSSSPSEFTDPSAPQPVFAPKQSNYRSIEEVEIQHHEVTERGFDLKSGEIESLTAAACLTPETCLKRETPDPRCESSSYPVPKPRKASRSVNVNSQQFAHRPEGDSDPILASQELNITLEPEQTSLKPTNVCQGPDLNEHCSNHDNTLLVDLETSLCSNHLQVSEEPTLDCRFLDSEVTPVDSDDVDMECILSQSPVLSVNSGSNSDELNCKSEVTAGSWEPIRIAQQRGVEVHEGFQRCGTARMSPVTQPNVFLTTRDMTNFKTPIVLDTGSGLMKAGFADQDLPNTIFPNIIGLPKYEEVMNGNLERETYIGHAAQHMRGVLTLKYPMQNGIIRNWDEMEKIWHHTFQQLQVDTEDHPVLLTEAAMNPLENRQRMVELMFECFNVPLTYVAMQAVLALYAAGRTTGVVFDSGDGVSHSVPVFEGYCLPHAVQRFTLAGHDITLHLKKLLQEDGVCMRTSAEIEIVRDMKEKSCWVSLDYESELRSGSARTETSYTMPDGQVVRLGTERFRAPEILFKPELIGRDHYGIHESIFKSILCSDIDLRRSFLGNIILSGGNTLLTGLPERLQNEIRTMVPMELADCVRVNGPKDRDFSVWCGGAVLANLSSFGSAWISQEEYEEYGPQIVFRKCF